MDTPSRQKLFRTNLAHLEKTDPLLAAQLSITDPSDVQFCLTEEKELNLVRDYQNQVYHYHSPADAKKEAIDWFETLDLHAATVIFIFGVGLGYYYEAARPWLKKHPRHKLIFLEQDLAVLHRLCETTLGGKLIRDQQVAIFHFHDPIEEIALFNELSWSYFESPLIISALRLYSEVGAQVYLQLHHQIVYHMEQKKTFVDEFLNYGLVFFRNYYPNLLELPKAYFGNALFRRFEGVPAIICGAGPSLSKNRELLKEVYNRALIFAGGSSLSALLPHGIIPHFGVAIDPNKEQYSRIASNQENPIPFFYRNRLFHEALTAIKGPRLYVTGAGYYEIAHWAESCLNIEGEDLDEGHNVVNFSLQIAQALGCNPIILVGVDLALSNHRFYAEGISNHLHLDEEAFQKKEITHSLPIAAVDIFGQPVETLWKWVAEAKWISRFAKLHPDIKFINATEGGLGFDGIPNQPLESVIREYLVQPKDVITRLDDIIQEHPLNGVTKEKIADLLQTMKESLDLCVILLSKLIEACDQQQWQMEQEEMAAYDMHSPRFALLEGELEEEIGYRYLLAQFNEVFIHTKHRAITEARSRTRKVSATTKALEMLAIKKEKWVFLRDVAQVNRELILHHLQHSVDL